MQTKERGKDSHVNDVLPCKPNMWFCMCIICDYKIKKDKRNWCDAVGRPLTLSEMHVWRACMRWQERGARTKAINKVNMRCRH